MRTGAQRTATLRQMENLDMEPAAPVLTRIEKEESTLEVWKQAQTGNNALLNSYPICKLSFAGRTLPRQLSPTNPNTVAHLRNNIRRKSTCEPLLCLLIGTGIPKPRRQEWVEPAK